MINSDSNVVEVRDGSSYNRFELGPLAMLVALAVVSIPIAFSVYAMADARATRDLYDRMSTEMKEVKTQAWLTERRYIDMESYAMLNGWKVPTDTAHGPTGNLERMTGKEKANGRK